MNKQATNTVFGLVLLLVFSAPLAAQTYQPLLQTDKNWDVFNWEGGSITPYVSGSRTYIQGDTLINGQTYRVLLSNRLASNDVVFAQPFYLSGNLVAGGFMREDNQTQRVYTWDPSSNQEFLTYDFSLEPGDSMQLGYLDSLFVHLDSIGTIQLENGENRRKFYFSGPYAEQDNYFYIEGIGGYAGLVYPFDSNFERGSDLNCVKQGNENLYSQGSCDLVLSHQEIPLTGTVSIYPNPVEDLVYFQADQHKIASVEVFNSLATSLAKKQINLESGRLDIGHLPTGIYLLRVNFEGGQYLVRKVVKR